MDGTDVPNEHGQGTTMVAETPSGHDGPREGTPTALITGATSGIGAEAAVTLAGRGWKVYVHGRNRRRGEAVVARVRAAGGDATFFQADFSSREAVRALADAVRSRTDRLDALVLNAALSTDECRLAWDGVEEVFAVNQVAPYLLAHDLVDMLTATVPSRVVITSSGVHSRGELDFDGPADIDCAGDYDALDSYARSKLANLVFAMALADRLDGTGVTVNALHPGFVPGSGLYRNAGLPFRVALTALRIIPFVGTSVEDGARGLVYLTDSESVADTTGAYFHGTRRVEPDARVANSALQTLVWDVSAAVAGVDSEWL